VESDPNGFENGFCVCDSRVDISPLQPATPNDISANVATCGRRRERSNSTIAGMVTHSYATNNEFE
jgi:hypothetical protein